LRTVPCVPHTHSSTPQLLNSSTPNSQHLLRYPYYHLTPNSPPLLSSSPATQRTITPSNLHSPASPSPSLVPSQHQSYTTHATLHRIAPKSPSSPSTPSTYRSRPKSFFPFVPSHDRTKFGSRVRRCKEAVVRLLGSYNYGGGGSRTCRGRVGVLPRFGEGKWIVMHTNRVVRGRKKRHVVFDMYTLSLLLCILQSTPALLSIPINVCVSNGVSSMRIRIAKTRKNTPYFIVIHNSLRKARYMHRK
jgi:hypothetical protein